MSSPLLPSTDKVIRITKLKHRRSSYSLSNAMCFKAVFDLAIEDKKNKLIPYKSEDQSPGAFHVKISDALRWLVVNWDRPEYELYRKIAGNSSYTQNDYAQLRGMIVLNRTEEGILLKFKFGSEDSQVKAFSIDEALLMGDKNWKFELLNFLEDPTKEILNLEGLLLTQNDIDYVTELLRGNEYLTFEAKINELRVIRKKKVV